MKKKIYLDGVHVRINKINDNLYAITIPLPGNQNEVRENGSLYEKLVTKCHGLHIWEYPGQLPQSDALTKTRTLLFDKQTCSKRIPIVCKLQKVIEEE